MPKVLIVDDNLEGCRPLARLISRQGHEVSCAASGPEALDLLRADGYGLVLLDIMMPEMDGIQVLRAMRADANPAVRTVPVLMYTALSDHEHVQRATAAGAQGYLVKGSSWELMRRTIEPHLA
jgi:CheY-like chemotaxis protein